MNLKIKEPKSLWGIIMDILTPRPARKTPEQLVNEHHAAVQSALKAELAGILAAALFAKKTLDTTRQVDTPFPDAYFSCELPLDDAGLAALAAYAADLQNFQADLLESGTPVTTTVARGLTTWIASLNSLMSPALVPKGKEIWQKLLTAEDAVEEGYKFFLRREPTEVEREYFSYRPKIFLT